MSPIKQLAVVLGSAFFAVSCTPYQEGLRIPGPPVDPGVNTSRNVVPAESVASSDQKEVKKVRKDAEDEVKKKKKTTSKPKTEDDDSSASSNSSDSSSSAKPKPKAKTYPYATAVPGKPGYVFSPYSQKVINVKDIPSGKLVKDPNDSSDTKRFFRVP